MANATCRTYADYVKSWNFSLLTDLWFPKMLAHIHMCIGLKGNAFFFQ